VIWSSTDPISSFRSRRTMANAKRVRGTCEALDWEGFTGAYGDLWLTAARPDPQYPVGGPGAVRSG
jgi:hypothetical protein